MASAGWFTLFVNCRLCVDGQLQPDQLVFSAEMGKILKRSGYIGGEVEDLEDAIVTAGYLQVVDHLELAQDLNVDTIDLRLDALARALVRTGVTGFWIYLPYPVIHQHGAMLPKLKPRACQAGATLLGIVVGPSERYHAGHMNPSERVQNACRVCRGKPAEAGERAVADAIRAVTEVPAKFMGQAGVEGRGLLVEGGRADLVVLGDDGEVSQTWVGGTRVWSRSN